MNQLTLFETAPCTQPASQTATEKGIAKAIDHAEAVVEGWADMAYEFLIDFLGQKEEFMAEDVREYAKGCGIPKPPSNRAWGGVIRRASHKGLIIQIGTRKVSNPKAHCANAALWARVA